MPDKRSWTFFSNLTRPAQASLLVICGMTAWLAWRLRDPCQPFESPCTPENGVMAFLIWSPFAALALLALLFGRSVEASAIVLVLTLIGIPPFILAGDGCALVSFAFYGWIAVIIGGLVAWYLFRASSSSD